MANEIESKSAKETEKSKTLDKLEDNSKYDYITVPPDGGFSWIVLVACFCISFIIDGFIYAFGAISEDLQKAYQCREWATSLVISLVCGFHLLTAPVASALCNKWGCRSIGICGSIIAAFSVAASILSPNIVIMWLLFGFIGGVGMGLVYLPSIVMVGYYFEMKREIATDIVAAGSSIGVIVYAPLSRFVFNIYGWKYGFILLSSTLLFCGICCTSMRPLKRIRKQRIVPSHNMVDEDLFIGMNSSSLSTKTKAANTTVVLSTIFPSNSSLDEMAMEEKTKKKPRTDSVISTKSQQSTRAEDTIHPLYKEDVIYQCNIRDLSEYQSQQDIPTQIQLTTKIPENIKETRMKSFLDVPLFMTHFSLLNNKKMIIICLANVCSIIGYYTPYLFIVKMAQYERHISQKPAVFLLSTIGVSSTVTRFASGWITKIPFMTPLLVNNIGLTIAGIAAVLVPLCHTYELLITYCIVWGASIALHVSLSPVVVCQLVGLESYSSAFDLTLMFRGATSLIAPPIMGAIRDYTSSFNIPFILSGISLIISAFMHFFLMWINNREEAKANKIKITNQFHENPQTVDT